MRKYFSIALATLIISGSTLASPEGQIQVQQTKGQTKQQTQQTQQVQQQPQQQANQASPCEILKTTYKSCEVLAKKNKILKKANECNSLSVRTALETYVYLNGSEAKENEKFNIAELIASACFGGCTQDKNVEKEIEMLCQISGNMK